LAPISSCTALFMDAIHCRSKKLNKMKFPFGTILGICAPPLSSSPVYALLILLTSFKMYLDVDRRGRIGGNIKYVDARTTINLSFRPFYYVVLTFTWPTKLNRRYRVGRICSCSQPPFSTLRSFSICPPKTQPLLSLDSRKMAWNITSKNYDGLRIT
jgi:hypothetical protein